MNGVIYTVAGRGVFISANDRPLAQVKKIAVKAFTESAKSAKDVGLSEETLIEIVQTIFERGETDG